MNGKTLALVCAILLAAFLLIMYLVGWGKCEWYGYVTERNVKYSGSVGCMVQTSSGLIPRNEIRTSLD